MDQFSAKLRRLFDAQDFFRDPALDALLDPERAVELSDDDLAFLAAAGDPFAKREDRDDGK